MITDELRYAAFRRSCGRISGVPFYIFADGSFPWRFVRFRKDEYLCVIHLVGSNWNQKDGLFSGIHLFCLYQAQKDGYLSAIHLF
jgi:hypothetical protein